MNIPEEKRGSEWRKWDLHIHTKGTNKNDQFSSPDFNTFCITLFKKAIENDIKAIGVTDYFSIDNYLKVRKFQEEINKNTQFSEEEKKYILGILIMPNVELRMLPVTDKGRLINIHCIFNPEPSFLKNLENDFFASIECNKFKMNRDGIIAYGKHLDSSLSDDMAYKKGIDNFCLSPEKFHDVISSKPELRDNVIIIVSNSSNDGASGIQKHYDLFENESGSLDGARQYIYKMSDCIFSSNRNDRDYFLGKKAGFSAEIVREKCGSLKPCIHGSDAHKEDKLFSPDDNKFCWIKADLTFSGLKQILYEPEERVIIQQDVPDDKSVYHVIDSVELDENNFWKGKFFLSENLNTIIGGRSTGKSTLLKSIAKKIDPNISTDRDDNGFIDGHLSSVCVRWKDGDTSSQREIDFFPQSYMYRIAKDEKLTNDLIQNIIKIRPENEIVKTYEEECSKTSKELITDIHDVQRLKNEIDELNRNLSEKGDKKGVEAEVERLRGKLDVLSHRVNISPEKLGTYSINQREILECEKRITQAEEDLLVLKNLQEISPVKNEYLKEINHYSLHLPENVSKISEYFQLLEEYDKEKREALVQDLIGSTNAQKEKEKARIIEIKSSEAFVEVEQYYKNNKELSDLQAKLKEEHIRLNDIAKNETEKQTHEKTLNSLLESIVQKHLSYKIGVEKVANDLLIEYDGIKISAKKQFLKEDLKDFLQSRLNQQGAERQDFLREFVDNYAEDTENRCRMFLEKAVENKITYKGSNANSNVLQELLGRPWFEYSYELSFQNDSFSEMSEGKQAFVILKLLLDFSTKRCPILIDQPEDSLDNRAIYNELVQYIKTKKKHRQIILVTHNPNVVVSADAENIIVANQHGTNSLNRDSLRFQYTNGALEDTMPNKKPEPEQYIVLESQGIREHVCEILEGGREAFEKREQKYGFR